MTPPDPRDLLAVAEGILNQFFPIITILIGITLGLALISMITTTIKRAFDGPVGEAPPYERGPVYSGELSDLYEDEPDDPAAAVYVECKRCAGVTAVFGGSGRCQYCGGAL